MATEFNCPQCGEGRNGGTFVLGHHYCLDCNIRFTDMGKIVGEGRA